MSIAIIYSDNEKSLKCRDIVLQEGKRRGWQFDSKRPDIVISIGGDGTLLRAVHRYISQLDHVRFVGLHTGHLGFYADFQMSEIKTLLDYIDKDEGEEVSYPLLSVSMLGKQDKLYYRLLALNESTIKRYEGTMTSDIVIGGKKFERFRGDGVCVSTPTGSTGLNKSLGGAVVHPRLEALQLTEIASLNNLVYRTLSSPILVAQDEKIDLYLDKEHLSGVIVTVDQLNYSLKNTTHLRFEIAPERVRFAGYRHLHFWDRVQQSFVGDPL